MDVTIEQRLLNSPSLFSTLILTNFGEHLEWSSRFSVNLSEQSDRHYLSRSIDAVASSALTTIPVKRADAAR